MNIKKGDKVVVIYGASRGKTGEVVRAFPQSGMVVVAGVNVKKKHQRARRSGQHGQVVEKTLPINVSNVMLLDSAAKRTRVGWKFVGEKRVRVARTNDKEV